MLSEYKITLSPLDEYGAPEGTQTLLQGAKTSLGFVPNMFANMGHSFGLLATYMDGYERFRRQSGFTPQEQEAIFLTISQENGCEYCVGAHSMLADKQSGMDMATIKALRAGDAPQDPKLASLCKFTRTLSSSRGLPNKKDVQDFLAAGYAEQQILELILAIGVKTMSNYSNHLFHTQLDPAFSDWQWSDQ